MVRRKHKNRHEDEDEDEDGDAEVAADEDLSVSSCFGNILCLTNCHFSSGPKIIGVKISSSGSIDDILQSH